MIDEAPAEILKSEIKLPFFTGSVPKAVKIVSPDPDHPGQELYYQGYQVDQPEDKLILSKLMDYFEASGKVGVKPIFNVFVETEGGGLFVLHALPPTSFNGPTKWFFEGARTPGMRTDLLDNKDLTVGHVFKFFSADRDTENGIRYSSVVTKILALVGDKKDHLPENEVHGQPSDLVKRYLEISNQSLYPTNEPKP